MFYQLIVDFPGSFNISQTIIIFKKLFFFNAQLKLPKYLKVAFRSKTDVGYQILA